MSAPDRTRAWAPASVSNLGPGFDALGAALSGLGDTVEVERSSHSHVEIAWHPDSVWVGSGDPQENTAAVAASRVALHAGYQGGLKLTIRKGLGVGTGLGSSAASAVAAAVATEALLGVRLDGDGMLDAVMAGEAVASGAGHGDNVLPSLLGGFVLMRSRQPSDLVRIPAWSTLRVVILMPRMRILTRDARSVLPTSIPLADAVDHASRLALLVDALHRRDADALGHWMMSDTLIEAARAGLLPHLTTLRGVALDAGAAGCTVSGSGPALLAICDAATSETVDAKAETIRTALLQSAAHHGWPSEASIHRISTHGARVQTVDGAASWRDGEACSWRGLATSA